MVYLFNNKQINIPDAEIENLVKSLDLTREEAIETWLVDNDYEENEEQNELQKKAGAIANVEPAKRFYTKPEKKRNVPHNYKVSEEKQIISDKLQAVLNEIATEKGGNVAIEIKNKRFLINIGEKSFSVDIVEHKKGRKKQ
jgi:hypothetical protein